MVTLEPESRATSMRIKQEMRDVHDKEGSKPAGLEGVSNWAEDMPVKSSSMFSA